MVARHTPPASYADIEALPPNMVGEIVRGVPYANPRPASRHARASTRLGADFDGPFDRGRGGPGGWVVLFEILRLDGGTYPLIATFAEDARVRAEPFDAIELGALWQR